MKVTAKMIADALGISTATVDRVLNNRNGVSAKTIKKVKLKAEELGYKPNRAAKFLSTQKTLNVAFILPLIPEYFWGEIQQEIMKAAALFEDFGFKAEVYRVESMPKEIQIHFIEKAITDNRHDALVIAPHDSKPFVDVINKGMELGIPVFSLNNDVPESRRIAFVGSDYFDAGYLAAELICLFAKKLDHIIIVREDEDTYQMVNKEQGFRAYFEEKQMKMKIETVPVTSSYTNPSFNASSHRFVQADGIYIANGILGEAAEFLKEIKMAKDKVIIGHDISEKINASLQSGIITATICQDPAAQASMMVKKVFDFLNSTEESSKENTIVKLEVVTKANAKYYLNQNEFRKNSKK
ncbi:LacI family DNA-binding transcriptional regulator [Domibacillus indicus]|uniref:LacI family DNA-binding transcriptional regulator n=1 Tax=Domibacillus indicus TaxID=1437523 RepID=UPI000B114B78|nr:LacI family DNA-binding transcriptional regulator [Domibacillus indicus]